MSSSSAPLTPFPKNIELLTEFDAIVVRRDWRTSAAYFLVFFTFIWNAFMVAWMTITISQGVWIMAAFGSIHALVGLGLIYFTLASFLNKTDIRITPYTLSIKHYPLRWFGQREYPVETIRQVFCKEKISRNKNNTSITYQVLFLDQNNRSQKILSGLTDSEQARFIENQVEKTLGIKNQSVSGEFRR